MGGRRGGDGALRRGGCAAARRRDRRVLPIRRPGGPRGAGASDRGRSAPARPAAGARRRRGHRGAQHPDDPAAVLARRAPSGVPRRGVVGAAGPARRRVPAGAGRPGRGRVSGRGGHCPPAGPARRRSRILTRPAPGRRAFRAQRCDVSAVRRRAWMGARTIGAVLRARDHVDREPFGEEGVRLGDIVLRNRLVTSSSLLGYGVSNSRLVPYGMSPVSLFVPLAEFGAVTTRTLTVEPREGHFTTRDEYALNELPGLLKRYGKVLRGTDAGWVNAFGWCNVGIEAYLRDYYPRTRDQRVIISLGGFSAEEFVTLVDRVNAAVPGGDIAAVEFNFPCHNVNFDFSTILQDVLDEAVPRSNHPVILKLSPDYDYLRNAEQAAKAGVAALTAINTVKALGLDPRTGEPWL